MILEVNKCSLVNLKFLIPYHDSVKYLDTILSVIEDLL